MATIKNKTVRGIRDKIPAGYVIGRTSGSGAAQLVKISDLATKSRKGGGSGLTPIADKEILANISGSSAVPIGETLSAILDDILGSTPGLVVNRGSSAWQALSQSNLLDGLGSTRGDILYRGASGWTGLTPGTSGQVLTSQGSGADPHWATSSSAAGANPTAMASDTAVNGVATTFMRSDAAPAVQKASTTQFGIVEVDGSTITASGGVISAAPAQIPYAEFAGYPTSTATAVTGDSTIYTIPAFTAEKNVGSAMNVSTGVWTAPATGIALVSGVFGLGALTASHTQGYGYAIRNGTDYFYCFFGNTANLRDSSNNCSVPISHAIPVNAGDTLKFAFRVSNGTKVVNIWGGISQTYLGVTFFKDSASGGGGSGLVSNMQFGLGSSGSNAGVSAIGHVFTVGSSPVNLKHASMVLTTVTGGVYKMGIAPFNTSTHQITAAPTYADASYTEASGALKLVSFAWSAGVTLSAGTNYIIFLVRTDSTTTVGITANFTTTSNCSDGLILNEVGAAGHLASLAPATTDTWTMNNATFVIPMTYTF